jgi:hypothetical protein
MQKKENSGILAVMVVLLMGIVCAGCITNTPTPPVLENTTSFNTSEACVCECGTIPVPVVTERYRPDSYWITIHPLANITSGATINITGETNLPVDTRLAVESVPPFRHHGKATAHILEGNITAAYVDPGNTRGVNIWGVVVNTTGYIHPGHGTDTCYVSVFPYFGVDCHNKTTFYLNESVDVPTERPRS